MKKTIYAIVFSILSSFAYSQKTLSSNYSYKVSEPYKMFDAKEKIYFAKNNEVMALKFDGKEVLIQKFNSDKPAFVKEKLYEKLFPKNYAVENVLEINNKYYFFYSSWDGDNDKEQLFSIEIDFDKGEFIDAPKPLFQVDGKIDGKIDYSTNSPTFGIGIGVGMVFFSPGVEIKFNFILSQDKKSILIQYRKKPKFKNDTKSFDIIGMHAYDGNLNKIYNNELTMPYTERRMDNLDYQLDNNGNLYLLVKVFHDDSNKEVTNKKANEANYHIELFLIKSGTNKIEVSKFDIKDKFINKLWLFDSGKDYLICGGFYSNGKGRKDDCDGITIFKIKSDGIMYDNTSHEIPLEILNQFESKKTKNKNEKKERKRDDAKFANLLLKGISINIDGSVVLIGEQYERVIITNYGPYGGGQTSITHHYSDMLVSKINANGSLGWMKKIPKNQVGSKGKGGMSYKYFNANNNHYIIFLDNVKNIDLSLDKEPKVHSDGKGGYITSVKISDTDGTLTKESILNSRDVEDFKIYQFATNRVVKTSEDTFVLEVYKKQKEDVMIKVTLK